MIKQNLQTLAHANNLTHHQFSEPQYLLEAGGVGLLARTIRSLRHYLAESSRKQALEAENRKAIEHLNTLTDGQLRDIGITRMDISRAVRYGRENI